MNVTTIGIDLAKSVFQVHGVDSRRPCGLAKAAQEVPASSFFGDLLPCLIGMESYCGYTLLCTDSWGAFGHTVKLIAPQFVKPYLKRTRTTQTMPRQSARPFRGPNMRFVQRE